MTNILGVWPVREASNLYVLNYNTVTNGMIEGITPQVVEFGNNGLAVRATADEGYCFLQWSDGVTENPRTDENVTESISVTAWFIPDLSISQVFFLDLAQTYDGTARTVMATTMPAGLVVDITYDGLPEPPVGAGSYAVTGTVNDAVYQGTESDTLVVAKATPSVTVWPVAAEITYGETLADAGLDDTDAESSVPGTYAYDDPSIAPPVGNYAVDVTFMPEDDANHAAVPGAGAVMVTVGKATQIVEFPSIPDQVQSDTVSLTATASSGLPVSFAVLPGSPAELSGGTNLSFTGEGEVAVVASQPGDQNWEAAPNVTNRFMVILGGEFEGGTGEGDDPFLIATAAHLNNVRNYLGAEHAGKHFLQIADIDLGVAPWNSAEGWMPIGTEAAPFMGVYDGDRREIAGLAIDRPGESHIGLFGYTQEAAIGNVRLTGVTIVNCQYYMGTVAGTLGSGSTLADCSSDGIMSGYGMIGGVVGQAEWDSTVTRCRSSCAVSGDSYIGGLVGYNNGGTVSECYAVGLVTASGMASGGLVGRSDGMILNCFAAGDVTGDVASGGLVGQLVQEVHNSYAVGRVTGEYFTSGGLVGTGGGGLPSVTNSYWNTETSAQAVSAYGGEGKPTDRLVRASEFPEWNFDEVWVIEEGASYPYLQWQAAVVSHNYPPTLLAPPLLAAVFGDGVVSLSWLVPSLGDPLYYRVYRDGVQIARVDDGTGYEDDSVENGMLYLYHVTAIYAGDVESDPSNIVQGYPHSGFAGGTGTEYDPYRIDSAERLNNVRHYHYNERIPTYFLQVADIELGVPPWNEGAGWEPIGFQYNPFRGVYDGDSLVISNLTINAAKSQIGLFGRIEDARLQRIVLERVSISGGSLDGNVGALAGWAESSEILACRVTGDISGGWNVGGFGGSMWDTRFSRSSAEVEVVGNDAVGGISGSFGGFSPIADSYVHGKVTGGQRVGGLAGDVRAAHLVNCFSTAEVSGTGEIGGLVGAGDFTWGGGVSNSYWDVEASRIAVSTGGEGRTTAEMTYPYAANTYVNWGFGSIWGRDEDGTRNGGYPFLRDAPLQHRVEYGVVSGMGSVAAESGGIALLSGEEVDHGAAILFEATPATGYQIQEWTLNGNPVAEHTNTQFTLENVTSAVTVRVSFEPIAVLYEVISPQGIPVPAAGSHTSFYGAVITNTVAVGAVTEGRTRHVVNGFQVTGADLLASSATSVVLRLTGDANLTWQWTTEYWLDAGAGPNGTIHALSGWMPSGDRVDILAQPALYYEFDRWMGVPPDQETDNPLALTMNGPQSVLARFAERVTEGTGTPLWWLADRGWSNDFEFAASDDPDEDRVPTWAEHLAGTDPDDPDCFFRFEEVVYADNHVGLFWPSLAGRQYWIEYTTNLAMNLWEPYPSGLRISSEPPRNRYDIPAADLPERARMFRVNVRMATNEVCYGAAYMAGPNGRIDGDAYQEVGGGETGQLVWAIPDEGYEFVRWSDGSTVNPRADMDLTGSLLVTAEFAPIAYAPEGMVLVRGGTFSMGDSLDDGYAWEEAPHSESVASFYLGKYPVEYADWQEVYAWALTNGYGFDHAGRGKATNHPVHSINWHDAAKWCNAKSEMEGLPPVYQVAGMVHRSGREMPDIDMEASGYRLPTETEWEYAARGGAPGRRFPWGMNIDHTLANYRANGSAYSYDDSGTQGNTFHEAQAVGEMPYTSPVGFFPPTGYGLFDMSGNVLEWCGDGTGEKRVLRGGSWSGDASQCRVSFRSLTGSGNAGDDLGFRIARQIRAD